MKEITVAISDTIGSTSFRNNTTLAHENIISFTEGHLLFNSEGKMSILYLIFAKIPVKNEKFYIERKSEFL